MLSCLKKGFIFYFLLLIAVEKTTEHYLSKSFRALIHDQKTNDMLKTPLCALGHSLVVLLAHHLPVDGLEERLPILIQYDLCTLLVSRHSLNLRDLARWFRSSGSICLSRESQLLWGYGIPWISCHLPVSLPPPVLRYPFVSW